MSISIGRSLGTENTSPLYINTENSNVLQIKSNNSNVLMKFPAYTVGNRKINGVDTYVIEHDNTVLAQYSSNIMKNYQYTEFVSNVDIQGELSINSIVNMTCNVSINQLTTDYVSIENLNNFSISSNSELLYDFGSNEVLYVKGNIGLGTSNPEAQLHVTNSIIADSNITSPTLYSQFLCNVASSITLNDNSIVIDSDSVIINNIVYSGDLNFDTINIENNNTNSAFTSNLVITNDKNEQHGIKINQINNGTFLNTADANAINIASEFPDTSTVPIFLIDTFGRIMSGKSSTKTVPESDFAYTYYINNSRKPYIEGFINLHSQDTNDKLVVNCNCFMGIGTDNVDHPLHIENPYTGSEPNLSIFPSIVGLYNTTSNEVSFFKCFNSNNDVLFNFTSNGSLVFGEESLYPAENYKLEINDSGYIKNLFTDQIVFNSNIDLNLNSNSIVNVSNIDITYITARDGLIDNLNVGSLVTESFSTDAFNYSDTGSTEFRVDAERFLYTGSNLVLNSSSTFFDTNPGLPDDNIRIYANGTATASVNAVNIIGETKNLGYKLNNTNTVVNSTAKLDLEVNDNRFIFGVINNSTTPGDSAEAFITTNTNLAETNRELTITSDGCRIGTALHLKQSGGTGTFGSITAGDKVLNVKGDLEVVTDSSVTSFYVNTDGKVGIGTDNPTEKLDVNGNARVDGSLDVIGTNSLNLIGTDNVYMNFYPDGSDGGRQGYIGYASSGTDNFTISNQNSSGDIRFNTNNQVQMLINPDGNVGIGVANPSNTLEVLNDIIISGATHCVLTLNADTNNYGENQTGRIDFKQDGGSLNSYIGGSHNELVIANTVPETSVGGGGVRFMVNNTTSNINSYDESLYAESQVNMTTAMYIIPSGRVGIGTDDPAQKLHVHDGGIVFSSLYNSTISTTTPVNNVIKNSAALTSGNWYRIAVNGSIPLTQSGVGSVSNAEGRCSARFTVMDTVGTKHSTRTFYAGGTFGVAPFINLLSNSWYQSYGSISKVRIIENNTYDGLAVEIYVDNNIEIGNARVAIDDNYQWSSFTLVDFALAPNVYNNYYEYEISLNNVAWGNFYNIGSDRIICMDTSGRVGIGTTNPAETLDVRGDIFNTGQFLNNASQSAGSPPYSFYADTNTGMYRVTTATLGFSTGGTERVRIDSSGRVGIGINSPEAYLDIGGSIDNDKPTPIQLRNGNYYPNTTTSQILFTYNNRSYTNTGYAHAIKTRHSSIINDDYYNTIDFFTYAHGSGSIIGNNHVMTLSSKHSGSVGIGTLFPRAKLHVEDGDAYIDGSVGIGTSNPLTSLSITPNSEGAKITLWDAGISTDHYGFGITSYQLNYDVNNTASSHVFYAGGKNGTGTELMRIKGDGKVGIGTNNPLRTLHVYDNSDTGTTTYPYVAIFERYVGDIQNSTNPAQGGLILLKTSDTNHYVSSAIGWAANNNDNAENDSSLSFWTTYNDTIYQRMLIDADGKVGIGTTNPIKTLDVRGDIFNTGQFLNNASQSATSPAYSFYFDDDTGMFRATTNELGFSTGGTERVRIDSSGYVGIGTNNPTGTLQVGHTTTTTDTSLLVLAGNSYTATIAAYGYSQGTARLYLGESSTYGGGIVFKGDDNPNIFSTRNALSFYRRYNGYEYEVFYYYHNSSIVNFTDSIRVGSGSTNYPPYSFTSDNNTGMYNPSNNELSFITYGIERVRIDGNGYVGIGTANPIRTLHVNGQTYISSGGLLMSSGLSNPNTRPSFVTGSTSASYEIRAISFSGSSLNDGFLRLRAGGGTSTARISYIDLSGYSTSSEMKQNIVFGTSGTERVRIKDNGYVGIGTTNPTSTLQVGHTTTTTDTSLHVLAGDSYTATIAAYGASQGTGQLYLGQSTSIGGGIIYNGNDEPNIFSTEDAVSFYRRTNGTDTQVFYYMYNNSTVNFTERIRVGSGSTSYPPYSFTSDSNTGMHNPSANELGFTTGSTERVRIDSSGYVGIGTTNPLRTLHVNGQTFINSGGLLMMAAYDATSRPSIVSGATQADYEIRAIPSTGTSSDYGFLRLRAGGGTNYTTTTSYIDLSGFSTSSEMKQNIVFGTSGRERVRIKDNGYVGIGTTSPAAKLDVYSNNSTGSSTNVALTIRADSNSYSSVTNGFGSRIQFQSNRGYQANQTMPSADIKAYIYSGAGSTGDYHALDLDVYGDNSTLRRGITIYARSSGIAETIVHGYLGIGTDPSNHLQVQGNTYCIGNITYTGSLTQSSDDRLKINEEYITSATETLLKLRPQVYDKLTSVGGDVSESRKEAGLIAQEVYVHAPELRYILDVPEEFKEDLDNYTNLYNEDPTIDPDYSGWNTSNVMGVDYQSLTPYLIKAVQEKHEELQETKIELQATKIELKETKIELQETKIELNNIKEFLSQKFPGEL